jgi:flagellin
VQAVAQALAGGNLSTTGTSFAIADLTALTTGAVTFTSTKSGVATAVTTGTIDDTRGTDVTAGFASVEEYAAALRADSNFSANFSVSVEKDANGAGTGIVVSALDGGAVAVTAPGTGLAAGTAGTALTGGVKFDSAANAQASITLIDAQIKTVSTARAGLGALQNRFEHTINNLNVSVENLSASESRIRDADMAQEMMEFTRNQILSQAGTAMLAQANQGSQGVLQLLR